MVPHEICTRTGCRSPSSRVHQNQAVAAMHTGIASVQAHYSANLGKYKKNFSTPNVESCRIRYFSQYHTFSAFPVKNSNFCRFSLKSMIFGSFSYVSKALSGVLCVLRVAHFMFGFKLFFTRKQTLFPTFLGFRLFSTY